MIVEWWMRKREMGDEVEDNVEYKSTNGNPVV